MIKKSLEEKKEEIIEFIKKNPNATYRKLKQAGYTHPDRIFSKGLKEAFEKAKIKPPRTFERKTREQRKEIIKKYIKEHPTAGGQNIQKDTKINLKNAFNNIQEAFEAAGVPYPREEFTKLRVRSREERENLIIEFIKKEPNSTIKEIMQELKINPYKLFDNFEEIYQLAKIEKIEKGKKRAIRKKEKIIEFLKKNPSATQREINRNCKTRIQGLFEKGIFGAYKEAGITFPFERLKLHGAAINEIKQRAKSFEGEIAQKLYCYGKVNRLVKTKRGIADIIFERKDKKVIIEIKDYLNKEICEHEIKQLNNYLEDCDCNLGFLVCHNKPQKDKVLIGKNKLIILDDSELDKIPAIIDSEI